METLHALLRHAFALLEEGVANPQSPWRNPALVTAAWGPDQPPGVRTVVLRAVDSHARQVVIHTDGRSAKMRAIAADAHCALHCWDAERRIQLRLTGRVAIAPEPEAQAAWDALSPEGRNTYAVALAPGAPIADPAEARRRQDEASARAAFTVLRIGLTALEYLTIPHGGHRRARFAWDEAGRLDASWLVP